jgi:DNA-binding NarL/FixJ family response regulator
MKTEENISRRPFLPQLHCQDGILLASEEFQTRTSFSMRAKSQPAGISVSVVHYDPDTSEVLSDWIGSAHGFYVASSHTTADSALAALPHEKPIIVLLDANLPDLSALDCLRQLKPIVQQTQFVMLLVEEDTDYIFNALTAGATGYMLRQATRNELLTALKLIHAGGSPISSSISKKVLQSFKLQSPNGTSELSPRETRILRLLSNASSHREVAAALNISLPMVSTYIRSIYEKLHLQAAAKILQ